MKSKQERVKILLIEDDLILSANVKEFLEEEGFEVSTEADGTKGLATIRQMLPDLIICDIALPAKNGFDILKETYNEESTRYIPFIFLTAKVEKEDFRKGMDLGADDYIFKPFNLTDLLNSVTLRLEKSRHRLYEEAQKKGKAYSEDDKLMVKVGRKIHLSPVAGLKYLVTESPYVKMKFSNGKNLLTRQSLSEWEEKLPPKQFVRIHQSIIINTGYIENIVQKPNYSIQIKLRDEEELFTVSKRFAPLFRKKFGR